MISMTNSEFNGWYFVSLVNGMGEGECKKCGKKVIVKSYGDLNSLKKCECKDKS